MTKTRLTEMLYLRVNPGFPKRFKKVANKYGNPADVHREILTAFIEGRVTFTPPPNPQKENIYDS